MGRSLCQQHSPFSALSPIYLFLWIMSKNYVSVSIYHILIILPLVIAFHDTRILQLMQTFRFSSSIKCPASKTKNGNYVIIRKNLHNFNFAFRKPLKISCLECFHIVLSDNFFFMSSNKFMAFNHYRINLVKIYFNCQRAGISVR